MNGWLRISIALTIWLACAPILSASPTSEELSKLFAAGHKNTTPSVDTARQIAHALKRANRDDLRIDYSFGLVLVNQRRYAQAEPLLARYVAAHPDDWTAHLIKLWNEMQAGQDASALDSMTELATLLGQSAAADPKADQLAAATFIGRCLAFLDRASQKRVDDDAIAARTTQIRSSLGDRYRSALDEGWQSVSQQAEEMLAAQQERIDREQAKAAQKEREVNADLEDTAKQIAAQREQSQSSLDSARDSQRELQNIRQQFASLSLDRSRVSAQIVAVQAQIAALQTPVTVSQSGSAVSGNPTSTANAAARTSLAVGIDRVAQLQSLSLALATLNKQAFDMDRLILSLQTRGAELTGVSQAEFKKLSESQAEAEKAAKKAEKLSKQLERQEAAAKKRPAGPTGRMLRFSTYAPLPYEQETKRVLSWFEK